MKIRKELFALTMSLPISACNNGFGEWSRSGLQYTVDKNTGLCFLVKDSVNINYYSISWVPCTKAVVAQLPDDLKAYPREVLATQPIRPTASSTRPHNLRRRPAGRSGVRSRKQMQTNTCEVLVSRSPTGDVSITEPYPRQVAELAVKDLNAKGSNMRAAGIVTKTKPAPCP